MNESLRALLNEQYKLVAELREENKKLDEKVRFLEECLDNKEKVNKSLREENKNLKNFLNRIKELYEDEEEAELLNYLDENLDEV